MKRRGRPPKVPADRKSVNLTFRFRGDLRGLLRNAAARNGWSLNAEIVHRLEQSFAVPEQVASIAAALEPLVARLLQNELARRSIPAGPKVIR